MIDSTSKHAVVGKILHKAKVSFNLSSKRYIAERSRNYISIDFDQINKIAVLTKMFFDELSYFIRSHMNFLVWASIGFALTISVYRYGIFEQADNEKRITSKIIFDESLLSLTSFKDSTLVLDDIVSSAKEFKVIVSLNASCELCIEELKKWIVLFSFLDRSKFDVAFISNNTTPELLNYHLRMVPEFQEHAFCDAQNIFLKSNNIRQSSTFKTFIIKGEDIVVWGTPFQSQSIRSDYLRYLSH